MNIPHSPRGFGSGMFVSKCSLFKAFCTTLLFAVLALGTMQAQVQDLCAEDFDANYGCGSGTSIEVFGAAAHDSITTNLAIPLDLANVDSMFVEVMMKGPVTDSFVDITITTSSLDTCIVGPVEIENRGSEEMAAAYRTVINAASMVTVTVDSSNFSDIQSVVVYAVTSGLECFGSAAQLRGVLLFHACDTQTFVSNIVTSQDRSVRIRIPISELGDGPGGMGGFDDRPAEITFEFYDGGGIINSWIDTVTGPDDNIGDYLAIYDTLVTGLPGTLDSLRMIFRSPGVPGFDSLACGTIGNGDSYIVGSILVQASCDTGACCEIVCTPPDTLQLTCNDEIPEIPASLLDSIGPRNAMGQNIDSLAFVDTLGGMLTQELCEYYITLASETEVFVGDTLYITRVFDIYYDSVGVYVFQTSCMQVICIAPAGEITLTCPPTDTAQCDISEIPPYASLDEFLAAGGMATATDTEIDTMSFTLISEETDNGFCPEIVTRTYQVADSCGFVVTCVHIVVVLDTTPPDLTCPPGDTMVQCIEDVPPAFADLDEFIAAGGTAFDNCALDSASFMLAGTMSDGMTCPEMIIRVYTILDSCGNLGMCMDTIIVNDTIPPMIVCPEDATFQCPDDIPAAYTSLDAFLADGGSVSDNCSIDSSSFTLLSRLSDGMTCPETITSTYQISDSCGNVATCQQVFIINDTIAPVIVCPPDLTFQCITDLPAEYASVGAFIAAGGSVSDNCSLDSSSFTLVSRLSDGMTCPETITSTYQIADSCGNVATCQQVIVINDTIPPVLNCPTAPGIAVCNSGEVPAFTSIEELIAGGGSAFDNCALDSASFTLLREDTTGFCPSTVTRTYQVADSCGNVATCMHQILVDDDIFPVLVCPPNDTAVCDISEIPPFTTIDEFIAAGGTATDNCGIAVFGLAFETITGTCPQVVVRAYFVVDTCGNESSCGHTIIVYDSIPPTISCIADTMVQCLDEVPAAYTNLDDFLADGGQVADNCALDSSSFVLLSRLSDGMTCPETITSTYQIADSCGNVATCVHTVTVNDTIPPTLVCPPDDTTLCDISEVPPYATLTLFIAAGGSASDNCGLVDDSFTLLSESSDGMTCPETVTRTYLVMDSCGNSATCQQLIIVNDTIPPTIACPPTTVVQCQDDVPAEYSTLDEFLTAGGTVADNCAIDSSSFTLLNRLSDGNICPETIISTYQIADSCGNTATCRHIIVVDDTEDPTLTCPPSDTVVCDINEWTPFASYAEFVAAGGSADDNCGIVEGSFSLVDILPTVDICPQTVLYTYTIEDTCGNIGFCVHTVIVNDTVPPTISCPGDTLVECDAAEVAILLSYREFLLAGGTFDDNCSIDSNSFTLISEVSDGLTCPETVTRTYQIMDSCGNAATCQQTIMVSDTTPPNLVCPTAMMFECGVDEAAYTTFEEFLAAGGTGDDNCALDTLSFTLLSETDDQMSCPETLVRTYQIADSCGNVATCQQIVMVNDTTPPILLCPTAPGIAICDASEVAVYTSLDELIQAGGSASDNCALDSSSFTLIREESNGLTCPETVTRTYQIADSCGNTATCQYIIIVDDNVDPTLICPDTSYAVCDISEVPPFADLDEFIAAGGSASDNCALDSSSFTLISTLVDLSCPELVIRTYQIADSCGNLATCDHITLVNDTIPPTITCPPDTNAVCDIGEVPPFQSYREFLLGGGTFDDNCSIDSASFTLLSEVSDGLTCPETITRTYQIADSCANTATCVQLVVVNDTIPPIITCPPTDTAICDISEVPALVTYSQFVAAGGSASDNCALDESSFTLVSEVSNGMICPETITRTYQIADSCGNTATCIQLIIVNDTIPPVLLCPTAPGFAECDVSEIPPFADLDEFLAGGGSAFDNCALDSASFTLLGEMSDGNTCPETITRTYSIADSCGNVATCQHIIIVDDNTPPMLTCPGPDTAICDISELPTIETLEDFLAAGGNAFDNCELDSASFTLIAEDIVGPCPTTIDRIYQVSDLCGNTATCLYSAIVDDTIPPVLVCPPDDTVVCSFLEFDLPTTYAEFMAAGGSATDNCGVDTSTFLIFDIVFGIDTCPQIILISYNISDSCGNVGFCVQTVIVNDTIPPMIVCPPEDTVECTGIATPVPPPFGGVDEFIAAGGSFSDNCEIDSSSLFVIDEELNFGDCFSLLTRTYQISDLCGNTATCTSSIRIIDTTPPTIACPPDVSIQCTDDLEPPYTTVGDFIAAGGMVSDICGLDTSLFELLDEVSDGMMCPETITRTYIAIDFCGNISTCTQRIFINDTIPPAVMCPPLVETQCSVDSIPVFSTFDEFLAAGGSASDNCALDSSSFTFLELVDGNPGTVCPDVLTRLYAIADSCGNVTSCRQVIVVNDTIPPMITCPPDVFTQGDTCSFMIDPIESYADFLAAGGSTSDNCGIDTASLTILIVSGIDFCGQSTTHTFIISDFCGNTASCSFTVAVEDTVPPMFVCPPDTMVECTIANAPVYANLDQFLGAGGMVSDGCEVDSMSLTLLSEVTDSMTCPETVTRTYQIADVCGNTSTCAQIITVNDMTPPSLTCPEPDTAICDASEIPPFATYTLFVAAGGNATDDCAIDESSFTLVSEVSDGMACPETVTRTYQIADSCGNVATCQHIIIVNDTVPPVLLCPTAPGMGVCDASEVPPFASLDDLILAGGGASDNCALDSMSFTFLGEESDGMTCPETVTRTYQIADSCGNVATCQHIILVDDNIPPMITCPPDEFTNGDTCSFPIVIFDSYAQFLNAGGSASDNCALDTSSFTLLFAASSISPCGQSTTFTYTVSDSCGNLASCSYSITVVDTVPPAFMCPPDTMTECSASDIAPYASLDEFLSDGGTVSDGCDVDSMSFTLLSEESDGLTCPETVTRTYQIADICGNTATCTQHITVNDLTPPMLTCPPSDTAVCDVSEIPPFATYTLFVAAGGNATDNCAIDESSFTLVSEVSDGMICPETVTRTYSIADSCGNVATCQQLIIVNDTIPPMIVCPAPAMAVCDSSEIPPFASLDEFLAAGGSASDNCALDSMSFSLIGELGDGATCPETVARTYQIADSCGNVATCVHIIIVEDLIPPTLTCPDADTVVCDISEWTPFADYAEFVAAGGSADDNCGIVEGSFSLVDILPTVDICPQTVLYTYTIEDSCGNIGFCVHTVIVNDTVPPTITCPPDTSVLCDIGEIPPFQSYREFILGGGIFDDNCSIDSLTFSLVGEVSDGAMCPETITRTYSIADSCGNIATCVQLITVNDTIPPMITCPADTMAVCDASEVAPFATYADFTAFGGNATDNCAIDESSFTLVSEESDGMTCPETVTRTYSIADSCGNVATCQQLIIVNDTIPPVILCPTAPGIAECDASEVPPFANLDSFLLMGGSVSDNCALDSASFSLISEESDGMTCPETVTRTYQIADSCGNVATCQHIIIVNDLTPPMLTCPAPDTGVCSVDEIPVFVTLDDFIAAGGNAFDNCALDSASFTLIAEDIVGPCPTTIDRIYQVSDLCGNTATCLYSAIVNDTVPPTLACPPTDTAECMVGMDMLYMTYSDFVAAGGSADDNCGVDTASFTLLSQVMAGMDCPMTITVTYQIADSCGNTASCTQNILVDDTIPPMITCLADTSVQCDPASPLPPVITSLDEFLAAGGNATDECMLDPASFTLVSEESDSAACSEQISRTYAIADFCGNVSTCVQVITIIDTIAPEIACPGDMTIECSIDSLPAYTTLDEFVAAGGTASDACSLDSMSFTLVSEVSDGMTCPETIVRTYRIADLCGNASSCTQTILVDDTIPPVITCVADTTISCSDTLPPYASLDEFIAAGGNAADECSLDSTSFSLVSETSDGMTCPETITRVYSIADSCGNVATCEQVITIDDLTPPQLTCPPADTALCSSDEVPPFASLDEYFAAGGGATDNCGLDSTSFTFVGEVSDGMMCPEMVTRTYIIADLCGNVTTCTHKIIVNDTVPPMLGFEPEQNGLSGGNGTPIQLGATIPAVTACSIDSVPPFADLDDYLDAGGTAEDNCGLDSASFTLMAETMIADGMCPDTVSRMYKIADLCGNTMTCTQFIIIDDTEAPVINCPGLEFECTDIENPITTIEGFINAGGSFSDNCGIDSASFTVISYNVAPDCPLVITIEYQIADNCGNTASCTSTAIVDDPEPPTIVCPEDTLVTCATLIPDPFTTLDEFLAAGGDAFDDCILDSTSFMLVSELNDEQTCPTTITRTYSIADLCGNVSTCQQLVIVNDTIPPMAVCMDITILFDDSLTVQITPEDIDGGSSDNCGDVTLAISDSIFTCEDFVDGNMEMPVVLTVTDECGNTSTCIAIVYGEGGDIEIECPQDVCIWLEPGLCEAVYNYEVIATANCGDQPMLLQIDDSGLTSGDYFPIGITEQTWVAFNSMGDSAFCTFYVEIKEFANPVDPVCNDELNVSVDQNCEALICADMILEGGPYGCYDDYIITVGGVGTDTGCVMVGSAQIGGTYMVTVTDPETGISCWSTIHIEDKFAPMLTCIDVTVTCVDDTDPVYTPPIVGTLNLTEFPNSPIGPDFGAVTTQVFNVVAPANAQVTDVNVLMDLTHTWSADLDVILIGPDGTVVDLAMDVCGTADNWSNVLFDDEAAGFACNGTPPPALTGPQQPAGNLSDFDGLDASGTWTLQITDDAGGDGGTLLIAGLQIGYFVAMPYAPIVHEACGSVDLSYEDEVSGDDCSGTIIERTWTAVDPSGNVGTCIQTITIEPLDLEMLEMPEAYIGSCGGSSDPSVTGWPTVDGIPIVNGNVCNIYATWEDKHLPDCGGGIKIVRYWTVLDWCTVEVEKGTQVIKLTDDQGPVLTCPPDQTVSSNPWYCNADVVLIAPEAYDACQTPFTLTPSASAGTIINFGNGNYRVDDIPLGQTVITWTAEDACGNTSTCSYVITVVDDVPPVPLCDEHTVVSLTTDQSIDQGLTKIPATVFDDGSYDNCGPVTFTARRMDSCIDFDWTTGGACVDDIPNGIVTAADRGTALRTCVPFACCDVGAGPIMVELRVEDAAGNVNSCMVEVVVQDKLSPIIIAPPNIVVSCDFWFDAAETNGFVPQEEDVLVPVFGQVLDAFDYEDSDRQDIIIDDPGNDELPQPYNWGRDGWADDNCDVEITVRVRIFDDCSGDDLPPGAPSPYTVRLIERTFLARDAQGNSQTATQRIWVVDFDPFYISDTNCANQDRNDGVIWPCDEEYTTCPENFEVNYPTIFDDNCSVIGVTYEDDVFEFVDGACYKILRKWTVIDWCQYDVQEGTGIWYYTQVIKVLDDTGAEFQDCPDGPVTLCVLDPGVTLPANNQVFLGEGNPGATSCSVHIEVEHNVYETCSDFVIYDVKVFPNNGSQFLQVVNKTEVETDSNDIATLTFDTKTSALLAVRQNGLPYNDRYCDNWPLSGGDKDYHRILWTVEDGCGNITTCSYLLRLEDCKAPSPVCVGLSSVVMPSSGEVTIWAKDFDASSFDDCTPAADLLFSFSGDSYQPSRSFSCDDIEENGSPQFIIEIWVADQGNDQDCDGFRPPSQNMGIQDGIEWSERNKDFCTTFIVIDDNENVCPDTGDMAGGVIETEELEKVEAVEVDLMDPTGQIMDSYVTGDDGNYFFINPLFTYTIEPHRDGDDMNGVSTLDLVRIQKHLLGIEPFTSPYKLIAADANNSQSVTALDLVELRKLILGLNLELPSNTSWRFVDAAFEFSDPGNPWPFAEIIELQGGFNMNEDFVAVKVGDVNNTVVANASQVETRSARNMLSLMAEDKVVDAGEEVTLEIRSSDFSNVVGYQFTLEATGLAIQDVAAGLLDMEESNIAVHRNAVTVSWFRVEPVSADGDDILFTMTFTAQKAGKLSEMLVITSSITEAEAYFEGSGDTEIRDIELTFGELPAVQYGPDFALFQNQPNPFRETTTIGFNLPEPMSAKLTVFDGSGRLIKVIEGEYDSGYNEVELKQDELSTTGILYYRLDAGSVSATGSADFTATKKMIIVE